MTLTGHLSFFQSSWAPNPINSPKFPYETIPHGKGHIQINFFHFPLRWFSARQEGVEFQSLVYLFISFIYLSLSHPLCCSSLSPTLIPYQPTDHPSPRCLSRQIHHPPICLVFPMLWDDLLGESHWRATEGGRNRGGIRKLQGNAKGLHPFPRNALSSFDYMVINCCVCFSIICLFSMPANSSRWEKSQRLWR